MARSTTERLSEKTVERQFLYELETDFELAPAASRAVLATAQQVRIVVRYLRRMTDSEIGRRARHAASSVKRYVETFGRVVVLWEKGVREAGEIGFLVGASERLVREYLGLRERYDREEYRDRIEEIARQVRRVLNGEWEENRA